MAKETQARHEREIAELRRQLREKKKKETKNLTERIKYQNVLFFSAHLEMRKWVIAALRRARGMPRWRRGMSRKAVLIPPSNILVVRCPFL